MEKIQGYMLEALRNVQVFLDDNHHRLPGINDTGARKRLDEILGDLNHHAKSQAGHKLMAEGETCAQRELRRVLLRDHMLPIARIAKVHRTEMPELHPFRMPAKRIAVERLVAEAHGIAKETRQYHEAFTSLGMPDDFADRLEAAATALAAATDVRAQYRGRRTAATAGIAVALADGRRIVNVLDAFVRRAVQDDPILLASWKQGKRVQRVPRRRSKDNDATLRSVDGEASALSA